MDARTLSMLPPARLFGTMLVTMRHRTHVLIRLTLGALLLGVPAASGAAEDSPTLCPICHHANNQSAPYAEHASSTLPRGALNTAFGWTELLVQPASEVEHSGNLITGLGKGVSHALKRTAQGIGELVTFWMPRSTAHPESIATDCPICHTALAPPASQPPVKKSR